MKDVVGLRGFGGGENASHIFLGMRCVGVAPDLLFLQRERALKFSVSVSSFNPSTKLAADS